jgi:lipoprotein-releasing system ATP-binding protein
MIQATGLHKRYGNLEVLRGIDLTINSGEIVSVVGASGAGKTTLLTILGTLDKADSGQLQIAGQDVTNLKPRDLAAFRNKNIGFIFQFHHLLPEFTALENVCMPALVARIPRLEAEKKAKELLNLLGLSEREEHKPAALSGGEQQRVAVARALVNSPGVVFADEPSGNLDSASAQHLHHLFFKLREQLGQTFVIVTHNEQLANMADRKLVMQDGKIG